MNPLHLLAHLFHLNLGRVYFFIDDTDHRGVRMVGHRCGTCGLISHSGPTGTMLTPDEVFALKHGEKEGAK